MASTGSGEEGEASQGETLNCPRCHSTNTKFCYYNNYSLSQPRYFCKSCRRYWTEGGTLRNVPVGGSSRKKKRFNSSSSSSLPSSFDASSAPLVSSTSRNLQPFKLIPHDLSYLGIEELMWPSKMNVSCEYGVGGMEERNEGGDGKIALPFEDLKQVTIRNACDEVVKGGVDPTLFWEGIMANNGGW